jgi:hypothetical protein
MAGADDIVTPAGALVYAHHLSGVTDSEIARIMGMHRNQVVRLRERTGQILKIAHGDQAIDAHREKLKELLPKTKTVFNRALDASESPLELGVAVRAAIALNKGLGVFVDKSEAKTESTTRHVEERRLTIKARLESAARLGAEIPAEAFEVVEAESIEELPAESDPPHAGGLTMPPPKSE